MPEHNKMKRFREVPMFPHNSIAVQECFRVIKTKQMIHASWEGGTPYAGQQKKKKNKTKRPPMFCKRGRVQ